MQVNSVALAATYSAVLSLQNIDTNGPVGFGLSVGQTPSDTFELYGTLDSAAVDNTNAYLIGVFSGGAQNLPRGIADQAKQWPFVLIRRTGGSTAGTLFVAGNPAADPGVVSTAAPVVVGNYSALLTLTTLNAQTIRIGASAAMLAADSFNVYVSNDSALAALTGAQFAGTIYGGGGANVNNTVLVSGFNYAVIRRASGSTAGTVIAAGVSPSSGGGSLSLTTLAVGNTAVSGPIGALTAAASVDIYSSFLLTQTTASVVATLPNPTVTTAGKVALVMNASTATQSIVMYGETIGVGAVQLFEWTGAAWVGGRNVTAGGNAFGAALSIGTVDNQTLNLLANNTVGYSDTGVLNTMGRVAGASAVTVQVGTGAANIAANATDHATNLGSTTGASLTTVQGGTSGVTVQPAATGPLTAKSGTTGAATFDSGSTGNVNIGTSADAKTITVGNVTGATAVVQLAGSGGVLTSTSGPVRTVASMVETPPAAIATGTGSLGTAAATVDVASVLEVNQTSAVVLYANMRLIQPPTDTTLHGRRVKIVNVGTAAFIVGDAIQKQGVNLVPGTTPGGAASASKGQACCFTWNGTAWVPDDTGNEAPTVEANLADADASIPRGGRVTVYRMPTLGTSRVLTASLTGALIGDIIYVVRDDGGSAVTLTINNAAAAALCVMPASKKGTAIIAYLGTGDWQLLGGGAF